jgi:chain length determinant protein tyrosine kinase EpsG
MNSITSAAEQDSVIEAASDTIGSILQAAGKLKPHDLERVLTLQAKHKLRFGEAAVKLGLVSEADIRQALSQQFEYPNFSVTQDGRATELTAATDPYGEKAEALRSLRSELLLRWFRDGRKTLAVGSAHANEGSSYLAANLAVLFAQIGRKVLLIDANLRKPRQHELFGLGNGTGLSDILAGRVPSPHVHSVKPFHNLSVLSAGSPPPNPAELLARPYFASLLTGLETGYDIILLDMAPSQTSSDFQAVAARVGGVVIATRRNVSSLVPLTAFKEKIVLAGAQVVGAVVLD